MWRKRERGGRKDRDKDERRDEKKTKAFRKERFGK